MNPFDAQFDKHEEEEKVPNYDLAKVLRKINKHSKYTDRIGGVAVGEICLNYYIRREIQQDLSSSQTPQKKD